MREVYKKAVLTKKPYDNCTMYDPNGLFLCRCNENKAKWYLSRNLAKKIKEDPLEIMLTFVPKGVGNRGDEFYLEKRENKCVVCGTEENLSKHHIVPQCYRRHFPSDNKDHSSHDVVLLCPKCHHSYERFADKLKNEFAENFKAPLHNKINKRIRRRRQVTGFAYNILRHNTIPLDKKEIMMQEIRGYLKKELVTQEDLIRLANLGKEPFFDYNHGRTVVKKLKDLENFVITWRQHFYDIMKPKFMPKNWDIKRKLEDR